MKCRLTPLLVCIRACPGSQHRCHREESRCRGTCSSRKAMAMRRQRGRSKDAHYLSTAQLVPVDPALVLILCSCPFRQPTSMPPLPRGKQMQRQLLHQRGLQQCAGSEVKAGLLRESRCSSSCRRHSAWLLRPSTWQKPFIR